VPSFRRGFLLLYPLWLLASPAAGGETLPSPSLPLVLPSYRLHLEVDEAIDPDRLRALARPGVVLWMRTRSNMLREAIAEALGRFGEAYVEMRPPLLETHLTQLRLAPSAGVWLEEGQLSGSGVYRVGSRRVAVRLEGAIEKVRAERIRRLHPARVIWTPGASPDLSAWATFAQLPGLKVLVLPNSQGQSWEGCASLWPRGAARGTVVTVALRPGDEAVPFPSDCRLAPRVRVAPTVSDPVLAQLFSAQPTAELELDVGSDERAVRAAVAFVQRLEAAVSSPPERSGGP